MGGGRFEEVFGEAEPRGGMSRVIDAIQQMFDHRTHVLLQMGEEIYLGKEDIRGQPSGVEVE